MPYYSSLKSQQSVANLPLLCVRTKFSGPVSGMPDGHSREEDPVGADIIDEAIYFFRSNVFFSSFEIKSEADRNLIYLTMYIIECLKIISRAKSRNSASQELTSLAIGNFTIPGDGKFPLNYYFTKPKTNQEADLMRSYLTQLRQECAVRLLDLAWPATDDKPCKWWTCFAKRKFLNLSLNEVR